MEKNQEPTDLMRRNACLKYVVLMQLYTPSKQDDSVLEPTETDAIAAFCSAQDAIDFFNNKECIIDWPDNWVGFEIVVYDKEGDDFKTYEAKSRDGLITYYKGSIVTDYKQYNDKQDAIKWAADREGEETDEERRSRIIIEDYLEKS